MTTTQAYEQAVALARERELVFVHPFDDPDVIAGQGTIAMEILRQRHGDDIDAIFVPIGGGGLIARHRRLREVAVSAHQDHRRGAGGLPPACTSRCAPASASRSTAVGIFADGVAVRRVGEETFRLAPQYVDEILLVTTDQICAAIQDIFEDTRSIAEPAGALGGRGYQEIRGARGVHGRAL